MKKGFRSLVETFARNWSSVVFTNALFVPFCLPFATWIVICQCYSSLLIKFESVLDSWYIITFAGLLPVILILFIGLAGSVYAHKKIFWDENGRPVRTFFEGIKRDWHRYLLYAFICWASTSIAVVTSAFALKCIDISVLSGLVVAISILQVFIVFPIVFCSMTQGAFYDEKLKNIFSNSLKILFMKPSLILYSAVALLPIAVTVILPLIWQLSMWVLFMMVFITVIEVFILHKCSVIFEKITNTSLKSSFTAEDPAENNGEEL